MKNIISILKNNKTNSISFVLFTLLSIIIFSFTFTLIIYLITFVVIIATKRIDEINNAIDEKNKDKEFINEFEEEEI